MNGTVVIVGTGGTISSRFDPELGRVVASESLENIVPLLPAKEGLPELEFVNLATVSGFMVSLDLVHRLAGRIDQILARPDVRGIVVTQGTDTMEETGFLTQLLIPQGKPVIFTGAQLPLDHPQSDGPRNLLDAIRAAMSTDLSGMGVLVCFAGELHSARDVTKVHTSALGTFQSPGPGPVALVDQEKIFVYRRPPLWRRFNIERLDKKIGLLQSVVGIGAESIMALLQANMDGIIIEAFGRGNVSPDLVEGIKEARAKDIPVIVTSRCSTGRVAPIYGGGGAGGRDLEDLGVIFAGDLKAPKARLLLMAALGDPSTRYRVREVFAQIAP